MKRVGCALRPHPRRGKRRVVAALLALCGGITKTTKVVTILEVWHGSTSSATVAAGRRAYGLRRADALPSTLTLGRPPVADRLLTRALRLDPLARTGGPDEHLPSTARVHRCARGGGPDMAQAGGRDGAKAEARSAAIAAALAAHSWKVTLLAKSAADKARDAWNHAPTKSYT